MNAKQNIVTLTKNTNKLSLGLPKFSTDISINAADASNPTIAGRSVENMLFTFCDSLFFMRYLLMQTIRIKGSHIMLKDARIAPSTAAHSG